VPILRTDYAHHFHQVSTVVEALSSVGRPWAYDPYFCAGYPVGTIFDVDMKLFEAVSFFLTRLGIGLPFVYNGLILLCFLAVPLMLHLTGRNFGLSPAGILTVTLTGVLLWHAHPMIVSFNSSGMCTFVLAVYVALLALSLMQRFLSERSWTVYFAFVAVLALGFMVHIALPIMLLAPALALYWYHWRKVTVRKHLLLLLAVVTTLALNYWWLITLLRFLPYRVETAFWQPPAIPDILRSILQLRGGNLVLGLLGLWGYSLFRAHNRPVATMGLVFVVYTFFLAHMASPIPFLRGLEPGRFTIPYVVGSMIGLSVGMVHAGLRLAPGWINFRTGWPLLLLILFFMGSFMAPRSAFQRGFSSHGGTVAPLVAWLRDNTDQTARIAFEDQSPGFLTGARMRYYLQREFIGGPFSQLNMKHAYASFTRTRFFDQGLDQLTLQDVMMRLERYNIGWIVTTTEEGYEVFNGFAPMTRLLKTFQVSTSGPPEPEPGGSPFTRYWRTPAGQRVCVFGVERPFDYFVTGKGRIDASLNRIEISEATAGGLVIKYHWLETLATDPPLPMKEYKMDRMAVGFIEVENGETTDFVIYNRY
jgi:hypothetical protein